jgi:two-component sensor histidine kinase
VVTTEQANGHVRLCISDNGVGFNSSARKGMGNRLIGSFARQLGGTFQYGGGQGTQFELVFPNAAPSPGERPDQESPDIGLYDAKTAA